MAIDPSGNVGIGTTSPGAKLDVDGNILAGGGNTSITSTGLFASSFIQVHNGDAATDPTNKIADLVLGNNNNFTDGILGRIIGVNSSLTSAEKRNSQIVLSNDGAVDSGKIIFSTSASGVLSSKLTILSSGNVGIGTSSPSSLLDVNGTGNFTGNLTLAAQLYQSTASGITASTTQTQGQQPLTKLVNQISTVANANDVVTLPTAVAGLSVLVVNYGANTLQIFPASGDNLGAGVDTSTTLGTGESKRFTAFDSTNWELENSTTTSSSTLPIGTMIDFAGTSAPTDYLLCDGSAIDRTTYAALFGIIGTTWGVGDGSTTFNIPDFRRRVSVGSGGTGTGTLGNAVADVGGAESVVLTGGNMPNTVPVATTTSSQILAASTAGGAHVPAVNSSETFGSGSNTAHNNIQPSAIVLKCIKYQ
jgi:microcystin-dependent protein